MPAAYGCHGLVSGVIVNYNGMQLIATLQIFGFDSIIHSNSIFASVQA